MNELRSNCCKAWVREFNFGKLGEKFGLEPNAIYLQCSKCHKPTEVEEREEEKNVE